VRLSILERPPNPNVALAACSGPLLRRLSASVEQFYEPLVETAYSLLYCLMPGAAGPGLSFEYVHERVAALLPAAECLASLLDHADPRHV